MVKQKKLLALICSLTMIFSMFSTFTWAKAEEVTKGIKLEYVANESTATKKVVKAYYVGYEDGIHSSKVEVSLPADIVSTITAVDVKSSFDGVKATTNKLESIKNTNSIKTTIASEDTLKSSDNSMMTITITLSEANTEAFDMAFITENAGSYVLRAGTTVGDYLSTGAIQVAGTTVPVWVDPSATPTTAPTATPTPRPTSPVRPTKAPIATVEPSAEPSVAPEVTKGIKLEYVASESTATKKVVKAYYVGYEDGIHSSKVEVSLPADIVSTITAVDVKSSFDGVKATTNKLESIKNTNSIKTTIASEDTLKSSDNSMMTITITLSEANTEAFDMAFITENAGSYVLRAGTTVGDYLSTGAIQVAGTTIPVYGVEPTAAPTATPIVKQVALKDNVGADANEAIKDAQKDSKDVYISVDFKKNDGTAAKYGEDFVAVYDKKTLTEDEYNNLINGYTESDMSKVIDGLTFNIYNSDVTSISTTVNAIDSEGNAEQIVDPKDNTLTPAKPTAKPSEPSISVKASSTTVEFDKKFTVTATVKNAKDGAKVAFTTNDDEKYAVIFGTPTEINSKGETKATYVANDKPGTVTITATYKDTEGNEKSASVKVTVKKASTTTGGNDGTTSGGGPGIIAPGNTGAVTTPNTNTNYKPDFQDLDSVEWARTAINGLAMRGMINGRDQYTFDPNANITRAEYCQILMGAINALNAKGESTFADVPSTAWYYNAVSVASQLGIVSGYGDGNFGPNDLITRQDMALMTYKTAQIMNKSLEPVNAEITFEDSHEIADYAFEAVMTLQKAGIINGMTDTTFEPLSNATRAQSAKVIFDTFVDAQ